MSSPTPDASAARLSLASDATRHDASSAARISEGELEKGNKFASGDDQEVEVENERDLDGVRMEGGVSVLGLTGSDDPLS